MPELRRDPIIGRWVIISSERGKKPSEFGRDMEPERGKLCPFCAGNEDKTPSEILAYAPLGREKNKPGWWMRVVPNKFPALQIEGELNRKGDGLYDKMNGIGAHEVLIETPDHFCEIADLDDQKVEDIFWAYKDRILDLGKDPRFEYVLVFKNKGFAAGASISHPHSQLIALPMVPQRVASEIKGSKRYYDYKERCIFCDIVAQELVTKERIVDENEKFVAFEPFAPRFPFETWVLPKHHESHFEDCQKPDMYLLSRLMKSVMGKLKNVLEDPSFNYIIHNSPVHEKHMPHYHWHIEIIPKLSRIAGFEWGSGFYINPTPPEEAAQFLRGA